MYELFEHTADIGIRARAGDLDALFAEAAKGLFSVLVANPEAIRPVQRVAFRLAGERLDDLLYDWLAEVLFTHETQRLLFSQFEVHLVEGRLEAVAYGEPFDPARHELDMEVKAVTYHGLKVEPCEEGFEAEVVVDL